MNEVRITYNPDPCCILPSQRRLGVSAMDVRTEAPMTPPLLHPRMGRSAINLAADVDSDCLSTSTSTTNEPPKKPRRGIIQRSVSSVIRKEDLPGSQSFRSRFPTYGSVSTVSEHAQSTPRRKHSIHSKGYVVARRGFVLFFTNHLIAFINLLPEIQRFLTYVTSILLWNA